MEITLNGQKHMLPKPLTIKEFLENEGYANKVVAIALNQNFIPKALHHETGINNGDVIEIVAPMQGG